MAELATLARPYAEALFLVARQLGPQALSDIAAQVTVMAAVKQPLLDPVQNLLRTVIDNGRLAALAQIASQYRELVNSQAGVHDAHIASAFPIESGQMGAVLQALEKRFGRRLNPIVTLQPELIGGIRVVVGDEVLDTSIRARLQQMSAALTA
jgi:F-type H+-transporting ATPase subunit delta